MSSDTAPSSRSILNDEKSPDSSWPPAEAIEHDLGRKPVLDIEAPNGVVDRRQLGLDLDDQRDSLGWSQRDDVDRPTLPELGEADLNVDLPAVAGEFGREGANEPGVTLVEEPVDEPASPRDGPLESGVHRPEDASQDANRQGRKMSALDQRDRRLRHVRRRGKIALKPVLPQS